MLAQLLHDVWPYQIFQSIFFRGSMAFLTTYLVIVLSMPAMIRLFRRKGITADLAATSAPSLPYVGPKPIMGGGLLILGILLSAVLWLHWNQFVIALLLIMLSFGCIGAWDDWAKVRRRRRIVSGEETSQSYAEKADGISGWSRLGLQILLATLVVIGLYLYVDIDGHLVIPMIPLKWWYPYLPRYFFVPFMVLIVVAGANAVNLTDGMDSLATVPILTCAVFAAAAAYVGADAEFHARLRLPALPLEMREMVVFGASVVSAGVAFLRFNAPPAMITLGDLGALALGSAIATMFIFAKVELFLPLVGGVFVLTTLSTIIQRVFFKLMLWLRGREIAQKVRFFYRAPYHHHLQLLWTHREQPLAVRSVWNELLQRIGLSPPATEDRLRRAGDVNSRVVWRLHLWSLWVFVLTVLIYYKVR